MSPTPEKQSADPPTGDCPDTSRRRRPPQWEAVIPILTQRETKALSSPPAPPSPPGRAPSRLRAPADSWWLVLGAQTQESLLSGKTDPSRAGKEGVPRAPTALHPGQDWEGGPLPLRGARPRLGSPGCCPAPGLPRPRPHPRPTEPHREERKVKGRLEDQPPHPAHPAPRPPSSCPRDSPGLGARETQDKSWPRGLGPRLSLGILLCGLGIISCGHQARYRGGSSVMVIL